MHYVPETVIVASKCTTLRQRSLAKCNLNVLLLIASPTASHVPSRNLANPVDPVLTAFDWILAYYTILALASWRQCVFGAVASHSVSLLPVSDTGKLSV